MPSGRNAGRASNASSRKYSYADPRSVRVPDLMTTLTCAPALRPCSASYVLCSIDTSLTASRLGLTTRRFRNRSLLSTPSSRKLLAASREPLLFRPVLPCVDRRDPGDGGATPGAWNVNWMTSRSDTGTVTSVSPSNTSPTAPLPARNVVRSALTTTCSVTSPGTSTTATVPRTPACTAMSRTISVLKPSRLACSV